MEFAYHIKPKNLVGEILMPLNRMKELRPEIYEIQIKKYEGREKLLKKPVPPLINNTDGNPKISLPSWEIRYRPCCPVASSLPIA